MKLPPFAIVVVASVSAAMILLTLVVICCIHCKRRSKLAKRNREEEADSESHFEMVDMGAQSPVPEVVTEPAMSNNTPIHYSGKPHRADPYMQATAPRQFIYPQLYGLQPHFPQNPAVRSGSGAQSPSEPSYAPRFLSYSQYPEMQLSHQQSSHNLC